MDAYGYILKGLAGKVPQEYIPSLIGVDSSHPADTTLAAYFERIELKDRTITSITTSKYISYDNVTEADPNPSINDVILMVRTPRGGYYIPKGELEEIAAFHHDDDTFDKLNELYGKLVEQFRKSA